MKEFIIDTGPLLLYTFSKFRRSYLKRVRPSDIPERDLPKVCEMMDRLVTSAKNIIITPYVLSELHALARSRGRLDGNMLVKFIETCNELLQKFDEKTIPKNQILTRKELWRLCFTDSSLLLAAHYFRLPIITSQQELKFVGKKCNVSVYHIYYDLFLMCEGLKD